MFIDEIDIPRTIVNALLHHAQSSPEKEICGFIASQNNIPTSAYPVTNASPYPKTRFQMDAKAQVDAMKIMREKNEEIFAIYHSHPTAPALPSETDLKEIAYPNGLHIIISLDTKGVLEMKAFRLTGDNKFREVTLSLKQMG